MNSTHSLSSPAEPGISAEQQELLEARYFQWGLERVRRELARVDRDVFLAPEVTAFTRLWIAAEEKAQRWEKFKGAALTYFGIMLSGAAIGALLKF